MLIQSTRNTARGAFTLMEMLIVVAIILILVGGGTMIIGRFRDDARVTKAKAQIKTLEQAAQAYENNYGALPDNLAVLTQPSADGGKAYVDASAIVSPWNTQFSYDPSGTNNGGNKPDIWVDTPDGKRIGNW
jgi:general secretion pathway protein G